MARVRAYIDGLNLFYGSLKGKPNLKWLDVVGLVDALMPNDSVEHVRYFSAPVSGKVDPGCPRRQEIYLRALRTLPRFSDHLGRFRTHPVDMPLATPASGGPRVARVIKTEEKGSDVNLATYLLIDGMDGLYEEALVISNDSDLVEPVGVANHRFGRIHVVRPNAHYNGQVAAAAASYSSIPNGVLLACQMPSTVRLANGKVVTRPTEWT
jgi:hypothetical protein